MKFLVLMAEEDTFDRWNALSDEEQQDVFDRFTAFTTAVKERGTVLAGEALDRPENARTVRPTDRPAGRAVTEGPFAETVEQLGGFYVVDLRRPGRRGRGRAPAAGELHRRGATGHRHGRLTQVRSVSTVEDAWREEWGRLLALLVARYRRLDLAEDGLGDAFEAAARTWPVDGDAGQPGRVVADGRPPPDPRPAARRGGARPQDPAAGRGVGADRGGAARDGRPRRPAPLTLPRGRTTSGCGWCCCARTRRSRP